MRIYLSAVLNNTIISKNKDVENLLKGNHILHSFAYDKPGIEKFYSMSKSILLDSGAFTLMNSKTRRNNFDPMDYCKKYAEHIKKNNIDLFMELDIEGVFGFDVYKDCLHQLQDITGKMPIICFHKWRGLNYYKEIVKRVPYVALGDVSVGSSARDLYKFFPWFINEAHKNNCRVHGLAFTAFKDLEYMEFDSVDSSTWLMGAKFAQSVRFDGHRIRKYDCRKGQSAERKLADNYTVNLHDYLQWCKFSQYYDHEMEPVW